MRSPDRLTGFRFSEVGYAPLSRLLLASTCLLFALLTGCRGGSGEADALLGAWQIDAETQEWLPRSCVDLDFTDAATAFVVARDGDEMTVRLGDRRETTFRGTFRDDLFDSRQLVPTSNTGRFCGPETTVRLRLDYRSAGPGALVGQWQTPDCDVCPDRRFGARRSEAAD